jgi:Ankyrin repeat
MRSTPDLLEDETETQENHDEDRMDPDRADSDSDSDEASDYSDAEEDDDDYGETANAVVSKASVKKKFEKIISDLSSNVLKLESEESLTRFMDQHPELSRTSSPKDQTLLHLFAEAGRDELPIRRIKGLVKALILLPENLLTKRDSDDKTPLYCAIALRNHKLARLMCEAHDDLDSVLRIQTKRTPNCVHLAIRNKQSPKDDELINFLIEKAGPDTLCATDENGLTPLHLAVDYSRCDQAQPSIVKTLVEKCEGTMLQVYEHKEKGPLSPYRYHDHTYQEAMDRENKERSLREAKKRHADDRKEGDTTLSAAAGTGSDSLRAARADRHAHTSRDRTKGHVDLLAPPTLSTRRAPMHLEAPTGKFGAGPAKAALADTPRLKARNHSETPVPTDSKKKRNKSSKVKPDEQSAMEIRKYLKLYYLRTQKYDEAMEFLYGDQQGRVHVVTHSVRHRVKLTCRDVRC